MSGSQWGWLQSHFDRLAGTDLLRQAVDAGTGIAEIRSAWRDELEAFKRTREQYLIYP
jgi:uncharacterized protein YbbC (DUF1343 family)